MKFQFSKSKSHAKAILFVCVENSARSQMSEGFFRKYAPQGYKSLSAGTKPSAKINPLVIQVMDEIGIDISKHSIEKVREIRDIIQQRVKELVTTLTSKLTPNQKKFAAEVIGTIIVVVFATGSVVIDAKLNGRLGVSFIAFAPFVGVAIGVYLFGRISMANFNPAVTVGFLITRHIRMVQFVVYYLTAEITGALLGSLFVKYVTGNEANLGANTPNYLYPIPIIFGIEVMASAFLMSVILIVVYTKGLKGFSGIAIGGMVGLDIFFLSFISGASMNPARSLAPALLSGAIGSLWLYWTATFVGTSIIAYLFRKKFVTFQ